MRVKFWTDIDDIANCIYASSYNFINQYDQLQRTHKKREFCCLKSLSVNESNNHTLFTICI